MPRYWILCMSEDNYEIAKQHGLIGMSERAGKAIQHIGIGDLITFYINRKTIDAAPNDPAAKVQQFRGIARVSGEAFESDDVIWHVRDSEIFPYRRAVEFLSDAKADVRPLIDKLSFVTSTMYWALPLRKGYVEITPKDLETIQATMEARGG
jgi:predicted RNA-binding protein